MSHAPPIFALSLLAAALAAACSEATGPDGGGPDPRPLDSLVFTRDWVPGSRDGRGRLMTGTETLWLTPHRGALYAGLGVWNLDESRGANPGAQILVKRSAASAWETDSDWPAVSGRVTALASVTLGTGRDGRPLASPVNLLVAAASRQPGAGEVRLYVRDDALGRWLPSRIASSGATSVDREARQVLVHRDRVTGADVLLVAVSSGAVYRGGYDPSSPTLLAWDSIPEVSGLSGRILGLASMNGDVYLSADPELASPGRGGLYRRVDGPAPRWERLGQWGTIPGEDNGLGWLRGLTPIPDPWNPASQVLLGGRSADRVIDRIDARAPSVPVQDADVRALLTRAWGVAPTWMIIAYNNFVPATDPRTGRPVHLVGLGASVPTSDDTLSGAAWYLVRDGPQAYRVGRVLVPEDGRLGLDFGLRAVRTIAPSPFPEEAGNVWYFGGFDGAQGPHYNTAWIYRGAVR